MFNGTLKIRFFIDISRSCLKNVISVVASLDPVKTALTVK